MDHLGESVDHSQDGAVALGGWEAGDEVKGNIQPWSTRDGKRAEESGRGMMGGLWEQTSQAATNSRVSASKVGQQKRRRMKLAVRVAPDVCQVLVVRPYNYGLLGPLQLVAPL